MGFLAKICTRFSRLPLYLGMKRLFDLLFSVCALILLAPLLLSIALLVKLSSRGTILYREERLGRGGRTITIYKFRSMYVGSHERLAKLLQDPVRRDEWETYHKLLDDPRCTPIGRFLRRTSLDELPQFFSVLKGDLSVVGPRPHHPLTSRASSLIRSQVGFVLTVDPGLTGLWQVSERNRASYSRRLQLECQYIHKRSFLYDLYLVIRTVPLILYPQKNTG